MAAFDTLFGDSLQHLLRRTEELASRSGLHQYSYLTGVKMQSPSLLVIADGGNDKLKRLTAASLCIHDLYPSET